MTKRPYIRISVIRFLMAFQIALSWQIYAQVPRPERPDRSNRLDELREPTTRDARPPRKSEKKAPTPATPPVYQGSYALLIGVSNYTNWRKLPGVKDELQLVRKALEQQGFTVRELIDPADRKNFQTTVEEFIQEYGLQPENRLLFYIAAHGYTQNEVDGRQTGFIVLKDSPLQPGLNYELFRKHSVTTDDIEAHARNLRSNHSLFVFNSCFSGTLVPGNGITMPDLNAPEAKLPVRHFITAGSGEQSVDDRGPFPKAFVKGIEGEANRDDDQYVTAYELGLFVYDQVRDVMGKDQTPYQAKIRDEKLQKGEFVFFISKPQQKRTFEYWLAEAEQAYRDGRDQTLASAAAEMMKLAPGDFRGHLYQILAHDADDSEDEERIVMDAADRVIELLPSPKTAEEFWARGLAHDRKKNVDAAMIDLSSAIKQDHMFVRGYMSRAALFNDQKKYKQALADAERAIKIDPAWHRLYSERGDAKAGEGRWQDALVDFEIFLKGMSKNEFLKGIDDESLNKIPDEEFEDFSSLWAEMLAYFKTLFRQVIRDDPPKVTAYLMLASLYHKKSDQKLLETVLNVAINEYKSSQLLYFFWLGLVRAKNDSRDAGIQYSDKLIALDPQQSIPYIIRSEYYRDKGEKKKALTDINQALRYAINPSWVYYTRAEYYLDDEKNLELALQDCEQALKLDPTLANAHFLKGKISAQRDDHDQAIGHFTKAIKHAPKYASAYVLRASASEKLDAWQEAINDYSEAIKLGNHAVYDSRGRAYVVTKQYDLAIEDLKKPLSPEYSKEYTKSDLAWVYYNLGRAYVGKDQREAAVLQFNKAIMLDPNYSDAYLGRGWVYLESQEYEQAISECTKAIELDPAHRIAYWQRGVSYGKVRDYQKALVDFGQDIKLGNLTTYSDRGAVYLRLEQYDKAIEDLERALKPDILKDHAEGVIPLSHFFLGKAYVAKEQHQKAIASFSVAIEMDSSKKFYYAARAESYRKLGLVDLAEKDEQKARN